MENGSSSVQTIETSIDMRLYRVTAVKKAAYRVAHTCTVVLGSPEGHQLPLKFSFRRDTSDSSAEEAVRLFHQDLLDEELRATLRGETDSLRALILAHTFSRTNLIED